MKALVLFLLFCATQLVSLLLALVLTGSEVLTSYQTGQHFKIQPLSYGLSLLCCELLLGFFLFRYLRRQPSLSPSSLLTGSLRLRQFSVVLGVPVLSLGLSLLLSPFDVSDEGTEQLFSEIARFPLGLLLLCLVGPFVEELVFRSGMVRMLRISGLSAFLSSGTAALAFAVVHGNLVQGIPALLIGLLFGFLYLRTGNMKLCLPAHIANNTVAALLMLIPGADRLTDGLSTPLLILLGVLYGLLGLALCWRALK